MVHVIFLLLDLTHHLVENQHLVDEMLLRTFVLQVRENLARHLIRFPCQFHTNYVPIRDVHVLRYELLVAC